MKPPFDRWNVSDVARALTEAMESHRVECEADAHALDAALQGTSLVPPVAGYVDDPDRIRRRLRFGDAFPTWPRFVAALREEDAGALEVGLRLLSRAAPERVLPLARRLLAAKPWRELGNQIGGALARVNDPAAVDLALSHSAVPFVMKGVAASVCARAWPRVMARLEASPVMDTTRKHPRAETHLVDSLIRYFGRNRTEEAWPLLVRLYTESVDEYVVLASGHALSAFDDDRSREVLTRFLASRSEHRRFFAVKAYLDKGAAHALDALGGLDALRKPSRMTLASELLEQAWQAAREAKKPIDDERYLDLALAWVHDRRTRGVARYVLDSFGKARVAAAKKRLSQAGKLATPAAPPRPKRADVVALRESMRRARTNLERIVSELRALGYAFDAKEPLGALPPAGTITAIEKALGSRLPVSLRAAFEILGACDLTGTFPGYPASLKSDAFVLVDAKSALEDALEEGGGEGQMSLAIAPDAVGKAGFSGGQEVILVPDGSLDARVLNVDGEPLFLDRLRQVFRYGGFPGLAGATGELGKIVKRLAGVCDEI